MKDAHFFHFLKALLYKGYKMCILRGMASPDKSDRTYRDYRVTNIWLISSMNLGQRIAAVRLGGSFYGASHSKTPLAICS